MRTIKLVLSYLGSCYLGWQKTSFGPSIEQALEDALTKILHHPLSLQAASRTDKGVHATGQVVAFRTPTSIPLFQLQRALNGTLPRDIAVLSIEEAPADFHPTLHAHSKEYWYHICTEATQLPFFRHTSWHFPYSLNIEAMEKGASYLLGTHDFSSFCNKRSLWDRNPLCTLQQISIHILELHRLRFYIVGDHFLYKMVRNIVGTLVYVGIHKLEADNIPSILASNDRSQAGITAPALGLSLQKVNYALCPTSNSREK